MPIFDQLDGHEQVVHGSDPASGLRCIIAIHSTALGPALGGTRMHPYGSEEEALADVLRLSASMTWKAACAGLDLGGGKAVIIGDPATGKSERLLRAYGRLVESLGGRYVTACDVGTTPADLELVGPVQLADGRSHREVDPVRGHDPRVARAAHTTRTTGRPSGLASDDLTDRHVAVLGLGKVGGRLVRHVLDDGGRVTVADVRPDAVAAVADDPRVTVVEPAALPFVEADVLSPNALGGLITEQVVGELRVRAVCGGANNQLATPAAGEALSDAGILYAPDYVVNAGGIIQVQEELHPGGFDEDRVRHRTETIDDTLAAIYARAAADGVSTAAAADAVARERVEAITGLRRFLLPGR